VPAKPGPLRPHEERLNFARQALAEPPPGTPALGDSFLIITEGEVTERLYFESIRQALKLNAVTVRVIHPECTDAEGLVRAAMEERDKISESRKNTSNREITSYDHVWVLFDTDVPVRQGQLAPALELAKAQNIHVGHSSPCVEIWLLLHFRDRPGALDSQALEHLLGEVWGQHYDKSLETFVRLWPILRANISAAVSRANQIRKYHQEADTKFPANPSTELDLLMHALNASVQPKLRIIH
jgi:hypothetical protein